MWEYCRNLQVFTSRKKEVDGAGKYFLTRNKITLRTTLKFSSHKLFSVPD